VISCDIGGTAATPPPEDELLDGEPLDDDVEAAADELELLLELVLEPQPTTASSAASASTASTPRRTVILFSLMRSVPSWLSGSLFASPSYQEGDAVLETPHTL
jgi:hypothetical protein